MFGNKGTVQIYTGDGKGKTTAALGLAIRAAGHGARVVIIQFMKGWNGYGELKVLAPLKNVTLMHTGAPKCVRPGAESEWDAGEAEKGMRFAKKYAAPQMCDMLILDEITWAISHGLLKTEDVLKLIDKKPEQLEIVITGRGAPQELIDRADLVSEIKEIKHPFAQGVKERQGIEY